MFHFKFNIDTPWKQKWDNVWAKDFGRLSEHKSLEMQFMKDFYLFGIDIDFSCALRGIDHAGPEIALSLFGYTFTMRIYDHRHWDDDNNCWEVYEEEKVEKENDSNDIGGVNDSI